MKIPNHFQSSTWKATHEENIVLFCLGPSHICSQLQAHTQCDELFHGQSHEYAEEHTQAACYLESHLPDHLQCLYSALAHRETVQNQNSATIMIFNCKACWDALIPKLKRRKKQNPTLSKVIKVQLRHNVLKRKRTAVTNP